MTPRRHPAPETLAPRGPRHINRQTGAVVPPLHAAATVAHDAACEAADDLLRLSIGPEAPEDPADDPERTPGAL